MDRDDRDSSFKELHACAAAALNGLTQPSLDEDDLIVTAGIKLQSNQAENNSRAQPASFVTVVLNGTDGPRNATTTVLSPSSGGNIETSQSQPVIGQNNNAIGHVSITSSADGHTDGSLLQYMRDMFFQQPNPEETAVKYPLPNPIRFFNILVKNVFNNNRAITLAVKETDTVDDLMQQVKEWVDIPPEQQRLIHKTKCLARGMTLGYYGIQEGSEILLEIRLRGG